jgi:predicted nucleic acid-binding protein
VIVVSDTSPITNLAAIGKLELLEKLYTRVLIPTAVYNEMVGVKSLVPGAVEVQTLPWIVTQSVVNTERVKEILENQENIDLGEAEAIVLTLELSADLLLMDERRGRLLAAEYGLKVTGLLGVLLQAKRNGLLLILKPLLDQLIDEADFRVSHELYTTILQAAGE